VLGLGSVTGLQSARILADRGVPVYGLATDPRHFPARTGVCERVLRSDVQGPGLLDDLLALGPTLSGRAVLVPCTDQSVLTVSRHRHVLAPWYHLRLPPDDVVHALTDKATFHEHVRSRGLPTPRTHVLRERHDAEIAAKDLDYPALLKPGFKTTRWKQHTCVKAVTVQDPDDLLAVYDRVGHWAETMVAQEYVVGGDDQLFTCNTHYGADGTPLVEFVTRKRRQWPIGVGTASYGEEARNDEVLAETRRLFSGIGFVGLGYLEVKCDRRTGRGSLIEANIGRPTGRSATAEAAGVELLFTFYCDAAGLVLPPVAQRRQRYVGAVWIDLRRDLLSSWQHRRDGELGVRDWWSSLRRRPKAHAVWSPRDPAPALFEVVQSGHQALRRLPGLLRRRLRPSGERRSGERRVAGRRPRRPPPRRVAETR